MYNNLSMWGGRRRGWGELQEEEQRKGWGWITNDWKGYTRRSEGNYTHTHTHTHTRALMHFCMYIEKPAFTLTGINKIQSLSLSLSLSLTLDSFTHLYIGVACPLGSIVSWTDLFLPSYVLKDSRYEQPHRERERYRESKHTDSLRVRYVGPIDLYSKKRSNSLSQYLFPLPLCLSLSPCLFLTISGLYLSLKKYGEVSCRYEYM